MDLSVFIFSYPAPLQCLRLSDCAALDLGEYGSGNRTGAPGFLVMQRSCRLDVYLAVSLKILEAMPAASCAGAFTSSGRHLAVFARREGHQCSVCFGSASVMDGSRAKEHVHQQAEIRDPFPFVRVDLNADP